MRFNYGTIVATLLACLYAQAMTAEVGWQLQAGGMFRKQYGTDNKYSDGGAMSFEVSGALLMMAFVSKKLPFMFETGLRYRSKHVLSQNDGYDFNPDDLADNLQYVQDNVNGYRANILEIPLNIGYQFNITQSHAVRIGAGPYAAAYLNRGSRNYGTPWTAGVGALAEYKYKAVSVGLAFQTPVIYNGPRDYYPGSLTLTLGLNFGSYTWNSIGHAANQLQHSVSNMNEQYYGSESESEETE